ncbi:MAG: methylated-DNA--[protein]-cysteine S-methyltransferase [bacterium]
MVAALVGRCSVATAIGPVALGWTADAIASVRLPAVVGAGDRLAGPSREIADEPRPTFVERACTGIRALLDGRPEDLTDVPVDVGPAGAFDLGVYRICRSIEVGSTLTYGEIARRLGEPHGAQAVGRAMARNPVPVLVPCHRVLGTGWIGGFSGAGGTSTKLRMLEIESIHSRDPFQTALPI